MHGIWAATNKSNMTSVTAASTNTTGTTTTTSKHRNKINNHKTSTPSSSSISTPTDKDSTDAAKLLQSLINGHSSKQLQQQNQQQQQQQQTPNELNVELRNLESWQDEDGQPIEEGCLEELVDPSNSNGWSADEMFKYNEKMHKITSTYNERTLSDNYTTPLPKINSKTTLKFVTQLAKEIEDRVLAEGRVTPESSDDDELFETERMRRVQTKQQKQLDQLMNLLRHSQQHGHSNSVNQTLSANKVVVNSSSSKANNKSPSQYSNSTETPATASLSSSPTLNDTIIKPVTSSSRNILRTCLT